MMTAYGLTMLEEQLLAVTSPRQDCPCASGTYKTACHPQSHSHNAAIAEHDSKVIAATRCSVKPH